MTEETAAAADLAAVKERSMASLKRYGVVRAGVFGSFVKGEQSSDSDVDFLVEFEPGTRMGLIRLSGLEIELGKIVGRKVDLNTPGFLSKYYCDQILTEADVQYEAA